MTSLELLKIAKPTLFNTDMVRAIQNNEKTVTRRVCHITINGNTPVNHKLCYIAEYPETNIDGLCVNFLVMGWSGFSSGLLTVPDERRFWK